MALAYPPAHEVQNLVQCRLPRGISKSRQKRKEMRREFSAKPEVIMIRMKKAEVDKEFSVMMTKAKKLHSEGKNLFAADSGIESSPPVMSEKEGDADDMPMGD